MKSILKMLVTVTIFFGIPGIVHSGGWIIGWEGPYKVGCRCRDQGA